MAQQTPAKQLFELLVTKNFDPECLDAVGKPSPDPAETEVFSFDYTAESGNDYGTVVIMLADDSDMQVYFGDNLGKGMEGEDKTQWFDFLYSLKHFATKNLMSFSPKNLNRLRYSMQGQAAIKEGLFESWTGTRTTSWNGTATEARLMIKHKRALGENDARFRYVESLFIETAEGERYKLPFTKLSGGRAMVEHVRNGGRPYDARGQHITEMVTELNVLSRFRRANHGKIFEGDTKDLVEQTNAYYESAQKILKSLSHGRGYTSYFESWNPNVITEEEAVVEGLKHLFVTQSLDSRIEDALPLLARIQQQGNAMKEANIFEAWADKLTEGTWATPDTPEKQKELIELLSKEFTVGADATNATEQLYNLLGDDELFDQLEALADQDPDADCRQVVTDRMDMLSNDPDIQAVITQLQVDPEAEMNPAEPTDAGMSAPQDQAQVPAEPVADEEDPNVPEVPTLEETNLEDILRIAGVPAKERPAPDYEDEICETDLEDVESIGGDSSDELMADVMTNQQGTDVNEEGLPEEKLCNMSEVGEACPVHGVEECWSNIPAMESASDPVLERMQQFAGIKEAGQEGSTAQVIKKILDPIAGAMGATAGGGGKAILIQPIGEEETDEEKDEESSSVAPFLGGAALGGAAGYTAAGGDLIGDIGSAIGGLLEKDEELNRMSDLAGIKKTVTDKEETDEGLLGGLTGAAIGAITPIPFGTAIGGAAGSAIQDKMDKAETDEGAITQAAGELGHVATDIIKAPVGFAQGMMNEPGVRADVPDEPTKKESALQGKYGHSGKMKAVANKPDFLTRLKELSGMMRSDKI